MLQQDRRETLSSGYVMPWAQHIPAKYSNAEHPHTLDEFATWPDLDKVGRYHLAYLRAVSASLRGDLRGVWEQVLAVGPFVGRKRRYTRIPLLIITNGEDVDVDFHDLGEKLADVYIEYKILPDLHLLSATAKKSLEQMHDDQWERTMRVSISLVRS